MPGLLQPSRSERGQMVVFAAFAMVAMMGFAALVIDLGLSTETKRDAQNDSDAMVLAGVQELAIRGYTATQRETNATLEAQSWSVLNEVASSEIVSIAYDTTCSGTSLPDTITVRLNKVQQTFLARVLGIDEVNLDVCSSARTGLAKGGPSLLPIGLLYQDPGVGGGICYYTDGTTDTNGNFTPHANFYYDPTDGSDFSLPPPINQTVAPGGADEVCIIKIPRPGAGETWANGNTGPIRLDEQSQVDPNNYQPNCNPDTANSGANEYGENIIGESDCPYAPGDKIRSLPGSQTGQTCSRFDDREALPHSTHLLASSTGLDAVFSDPVVINGRTVYREVDTENPHFGIIPVTTAQSGGTTWVTIVKFVTVYIIGCDTTSGGNNALYTVTVIPVESQYFASGQDFVDIANLGNYTSDWPAYTIKLVE